MSKVRIDVKTDLHGTPEKLDKTSDSLKGMKDQADKGVSSLSGLWKQFAAGMLAVGGLDTAIRGAKGLIGSFINVARETENYRLRLQTLLGSVEEGNRLFDEMEEYASKVPFELDEIISSATTLSGVMEGGVDEIKQWMPLIGDLAAAYGMSIEEVTSQVVRMYSAGAQSAETFKEKGTLSALGFKMGVSYSVEETRRMLMEAWKDPESKFRGATDRMKDTWDGSMTMLRDEWRKFQQAVMDAGVFEVLKEGLSDVVKWAQELSESGKLEEWAKKTAAAIETLLEKLMNIPDAIDAVIGGFKSGGFTGAMQEITDKLSGVKDHLRDVEMEARLRAADFKNSLEVLKPSMEDIRIEFEKGEEHADAWMQSMKDQDARLAANKDAYIEVSDKLFKYLGLISDAKPKVDDTMTSVELLTTALQAQNRELELLFENLDQTVLPAYREWPGLAYNTQEEIKSHVFNANDEIVRDIDTTITQEISPLWQGLSNDLSRSFGDAFEDILTEGSDFGDAMDLLFEGIVDSVRGFFAQMVTDFLKNNVFDFMSKEAKKATDDVKDAAKELAGGAAGAASGAVSGLWTAGGAFLGTLAGNLLTGGFPKASQQHIQQIVDATRGTRDALLIDYKEEVHIMQNALRGIFDKSEALTIKADIRNRHLEAIKRSLEGTVSAQGGFSGTLTRDTMIRAHAGETWNVQPPAINFSPHFQTMIIEKNDKYIVKVVQDNLDRGNLRVPGIHK